MFFFFNDTATTEIYTLSLHDALPILSRQRPRPLDLLAGVERPRPRLRRLAAGARDRKSTRLNSSHANISYAVFCLKKKFKLDSEPDRRQSAANLARCVLMPVVHMPPL